MRKFNFSICVIVKNEENTLPKLIATVKKYMDEGLEFNILDTGSEDKTVEVAKSLGCRVLEVGDKFLETISQELADNINKIVELGEKPVIKVGDRVFHFADARNCLAEFSTYDVVAMPDADEIYTTFDVDKIIQAIDSGTEQLEYNFCFSHDEWNNPIVKFLHSKFYDRRKLKWEHIVHEVLASIEPNTNIKRQFFWENIIYLEHYQNSTTNRGGYLQGLALDQHLNPNNDRNCHYFGRELLYRGRYKTALKVFEKHIAMNCWLEERGQSLIHMADCYSMLGDEEKQIEYYLKSFTLDGSRREPLIKLASFYKERAVRKNNPSSQKDLRKCICYAVASLEIPWNAFYGNIMEHYSNTPYELLYVAKGWLGQQEESKKYWELALKEKPNHPKYINDTIYYDEEYKNLPDGYFSATDIKEYSRLIEQIPDGGTMAELGTWKGRSLCSIAEVIKRKKINVIAVDTFDGTANEGEAHKEAKNIDLKAELEKNLTRYGIIDQVSIFKMTTHEASQLQSIGVNKFDLAFVDADHSYSAVKQDIIDWLPLLKEEGTIAGHDYHPNWGVFKAVNEAFGKNFKIGKSSIVWSCKIDKDVILPQETGIIPKSIFTIWLNENSEYPDLVKKCIESQKIKGYEHKVITLQDIEELKIIPYVKQFFESKNPNRKWAKLVDFIRIYELFEHGGIYLDADAEVLSGKNFDELLKYEMFVGREENRFLAIGAIGAKKGHLLLKTVMDEITTKFRGDDDFVFEAGMGLFTPIYYTTRNQNMIILDPDYLTPYNHQTGKTNVTERTIVYHHYLKSWK